MGGGGYGQRLVESVWSGKVVGISKKTWSDKFFKLEDSSEIVAAFCKLGEEEICLPLEP